jgi:protein phosphatase
MGGAQAGEVASRLAAGVLKESDEAGTGEARVVELVREANRRVYLRSNEDTEAQGMGTTMTVALVDSGASTLAIGHVGDSRAYRVRDGQLEQLTEDHSLVQELVRSGRLSPEEADSHPQRSVITRALGTDADVDVDTLTVETRPGDLYLLCSDGLTSMVGDPEILSTVESRHGDLEGLVKALVDAANRGGGEDNVTVVVFEIAGDSEDGSGETPTLPATEPHRVVQQDTLADEDDEDTLDELDSVPAVHTAVISAEEIRRQLATAKAEQEASEAAAPVAEARPTRRHGAGSGSRWPALLALVLALALIAALVVWGITR